MYFPDSFDIFQPILQFQMFERPQDNLGWLLLSLLRRSDAQGSNGRPLTALKVAALTGWVFDCFENLILIFPLSENFIGLVNERVELVEPHVHDSEILEHSDHLVGEVST